MMDDTLSVLVRPAVLSDLDSLVIGNAALAWETEQRQLDRTRLRSGVLALLQDPQKGWYIVAEATTTTSGPRSIVGQLLVTFEWSDWRNGNFWWLQSVYVEPAYRRKNVFKRLYAYVRKEAERQQEEICGFRLYVEQENAIAHQSYDRVGFQEAPYRMYECELSSSQFRSPWNSPSGEPAKGD